MAKRFPVKIQSGDFQAEEAFASKADAEAWRTMVQTTLEHRERANFDLAVYAAGLAETVRDCGGAYTMEKWLNIEVPHEQWSRGIPVPIDYEAMLRDALKGQKPVARPKKPNS